MESKESSKLPVIKTHRVNRFADLGFLPQRWSIEPFEELCISHFPRTVKELLNLDLDLKKPRLVWVTDTVLIMGYCSYCLKYNFEPIERLPECYMKVAFGDQNDDGEFFCPSPHTTYSPTQWSREDKGLTYIDIFAFSADDAVSVLEKLAQLPDNHDFVWKIDLRILDEPDHIRRVLECLPTSVRRDFKFIERTIEAELCSLVLAPRGSHIKLYFERCWLYREAEEALVHAVEAREDTVNHLLWLQLNHTFLETQNFIRLLESKKVDTLEFNEYVLARLDKNCIQALTQSQLRRLHVHPTQPIFGPVEEYLRLPFLNSLQFGGNHLKELVLHNVSLDEGDPNCLVTILGSNPGLTFFGIIASNLCMQRWLELLDAIRTHPSLTCLNLSVNWKWYDRYREERTDALSRLLSENPRIEKLYGDHACAYYVDQFEECVEPKLEWNWYRKRVQTLRGIDDTLTRDALLAKALAVLDGKPSVRYLLLSEYCDVIVMHVSDRYDRKGLKRRRDSLR